MVSEGKVADGVRPEIGRSWERCLHFGLSASEPKRQLDLSTKEFHQICTSIGSFLDVITRHLSSFWIATKEVDVCGIVQHREGGVLALDGPSSLVGELEALGIRKASNCSEKCLGTWAPSLSLSERKPVEVIGEEHYKAYLQGLIGLAIPIRDEEREPWGSIGLVTRYTRKSEGFRASLMRSLETLLQIIQMEKKISTLMKSVELSEAAFDSMKDGILVIGADGIINYSNRAFSGMSLSDRNKFKGSHYEDLFPTLANLDRSREHRVPTVLEVGGKKAFFDVEVWPLLKERPGEGGAVLTFKLRKTSGPVSPTRFAARNPFFEGLVGTSHAFRKAVHIAMITAKSRSNILLQGETGTGKEVFARFIHLQSSRSRKQFVAINCAAIPYELAESELFGYEPGAFTGAGPKGQLGKFELANGGTLFLDEINSLDKSIQAKLLRVIETQEIMRLGARVVRSIDVRIIAASTVDLREEVLHGRFKPELLYRVNAITITMPPLRERREDVVLLLDHFIRQLESEFQKEVKNITLEAIQTLEAYHWPGNIRELKNVARYILTVMEGQDVGLNELPEEIVSHSGRSSPSSKLEFERCSKERQVLTKAIHEASGNMRFAASILGISRSTLYRKVRDYGIKVFT